MSPVFPLAAAIAALPLIALGQPGRADATDPAAGASTRPYHSAFTDYRPMQEAGEPSLERWRALNEEVARVGGHAGAIKDDTQAVSGSPARAEPPPPAARTRQHAH